MEIKIEGDHCATCLSYGRTLTTLGAYSDLFCKLLDHSIFDYYNNVKYIKICWECRAALRKFSQFQRRVFLAADIFQQSMLLDHKLTLSTLQKHNIDDNLIIPCSYEETVESEHAINVNIEEQVKIEDDILNEDFFDDTEFPEVKEDVNLKEEPKKDKKELIKEKKEKKKSFNKKYKVLSVDNTMRKEGITDVNTYIKKEKQSQFFKTKLYKCNKCVVSFRNIKLLSDHQKENHQKFPNCVQCKICESHFADGEALSQHEHNHYQKYVCNKCEYECLTKIHMQWHMRTKHRHKTIYQCNLCELQFVYRKMNKHYKEWHQKFICDHCGATFKTRGSIKGHIERKHSAFHCKLCNKTFASRKYHLLHNSYYHGKKKGETAYCVECDKTFKSMKAYKSHINGTFIHRKEKTSFPCSACDKSFSKRYYLNEHYKYEHLKVERHRCTQCDKTFTRADHLSRHVRRVHLRIPPVKDKVCNVCGRAFSAKQILIRHLRTHTGEKPHECPRCPAAFGQRTALVTHVRAVHKERIDYKMSNAQNNM